MIEINKNVNFSKSGYPLVRRILFNKQLDCDDYEAYEWNVISKSFDLI